MKQTIDVPEGPDCKDDNGTCDEIHSVPASGYSCRFGKQSFVFNGMFGRKHPKCVLACQQYREAHPDIKKKSVDR